MYSAYNQLVFLILCSHCLFYESPHWLSLWFRDPQVTGSTLVGTVKAMSSSKKYNLKICERAIFSLEK